MRSDVKVAVVIPCYNTGQACLEVITRARTSANSVLVVDDGSTDDTPQHIAAAGAPCLRLPVNAGKGAALKAGIEEVLKGRDGRLGDVFDFILTVDGDGQHDPSDIPRFVSLATREHADLVIGVRNVRVMPPKSKIGNYFSRLVFFLGTGRYVPDTQSGFRLFSRSLAEALLTAVSWRRYETEAEILTKAVALGYTVDTVEIPTIYFDENRRTHFDPLWDSMRVIAVLSRYALSSLAVTAVDFSAFVLLLPYVSDNVVRANVLARAFAVVAHFVLSREYVFRARGQFKLSEVIRYLAIVVANLALTTWLLLIFQGGGATPVSAKILAQLAGFLFTFVVLDRFVFRGPSEERTNWEEYYRHPFPASRWSRGIMSGMLHDLITAHAPRRQPLAVLELGGGNSCFLEGLLKDLPIAPYVVLDNSPEGMRLARERFGPAYGDRVGYVEDDAFAAAIDRTFDIVYSVGLIEHFDDRAMKKLIGLHRRWAAPDGLVLIAVPTPTIFYRIFRTGAEILGLWKFPDEHPVPRARLAALMRDEGLEIIFEKTLWSQVLTQAIIAARPVPAAVARTPA
jgi:glycosyltransferase involved in cell wall biosynthesis/ubiquinone/menaquinone biosynthesis C-methylase UbiE